MLKSDYSDPVFQNHGFINHIHHVVFDAGVFPNTQTPLLELYKIVMISNLAALGDKGGKPRNLALFRKIIAPNTLISAGKWDLLKMWQEGRDYEESSAAGSVSINPLNGNVHVVLSFGKANDDGVIAFQTWENVIPRNSFAQPIVRLPVLAADSALFAAVEALQRLSQAQAQTIAGIETALGNLRSGGLDAGDRVALDRLRTMIGV